MLLSKKEGTSVLIADELDFEKKITKTEAEALKPT